MIMWWIYDSFIRLCHVYKEIRGEFVPSWNHVVLQIQRQLDSKPQGLYLLRDGRFIVRFREVSKLWDLCLSYSNRTEIWQAPR